MTQLSDISLVTQVAVFRNKRAFDQLVRKYQSPVRRFLLNLTLGDKPLSDDLAQDTFLKAYTAIGQYKALSSFQTWLFRIAYNVFYDYKRRHRLQCEDISDRTASDTATVQPAAGTSLGIDIHTALAQLKADERTCVTLQLIDGESIDHISQITGMAQNTVKSHLRRGKERLANYLRHNGYE